MDGDIVGAVGQAPVQGPAEALRRILRESGDQVHVHMGKPHRATSSMARSMSASRVAPADGPQHVLLHGLGVHRDPGDPVGASTASFSAVMVSGRPASTVISLQAVRSKDGLKGSEDPVHLLRRQGGGGAAAHVEGPHPQPARRTISPPAEISATQGVHIGGTRAKLRSTDWLTKEQ